MWDVKISTISILTYLSSVVKHVAQIQVVTGSLFKIRHLIVFYVTSLREMEIIRYSLVPLLSKKVGILRLKKFSSQ